jgi:hypothetical protein
VYIASWQHLFCGITQTQEWSRGYMACLVCADQCNPYGCYFKGRWADSKFYLHGFRWAVGRLACFFDWGSSSRQIICHIHLEFLLYHCLCVGFLVWFGGIFFNLFFCDVIWYICKLQLGWHPVAVVHLHTNNAQNNTMKQNTQHITCITIRIHKHDNKNTQLNRSIQNIQPYIKW